MYKNYKFHDENLSGYKFLVTGGAGFIGSNIVEYLLEHNAGLVRVLDDLSNGYYENIESYECLSNFQFIQGDIRDYDTCKNALVDIDFVTHQAALGSVPRSVVNPILTNEVNISGFLNVFMAARDSKSLKRMIFAASSSSYGDSAQLPKIEGQEGKPLSPYAVTKLVNEIYAEVFSKVYDFHTIGLRYFNVFGPRQNPKNPYAAVIPIFCDNFVRDVSPIINGDGKTSRDFTYVVDAVQANIKALFLQPLSKYETFNIASGRQIELNEIVTLLSDISGKSICPVYKEERVGDVKHSLADLHKSKNVLNYFPQSEFRESLRFVFDFIKKKDSL